MITISDKIVLSDGSVIDNTDEAIRQHNEQTARDIAKAHTDHNRQQQDNKTGKLCPVDALEAVHDCQKNCALYRSTGCTLKHRQPERETAGLPCPLMRKCNDQCALYEKGCTL